MQAAQESSMILLIVFTAVAHCVPYSSVPFRPEPMTFEEWADAAMIAQGHTVDREAHECRSPENGRNRRCGGQRESDPDGTIVDAKIRGVREYYNSPRAMALMRSQRTLPQREFHSPFQVHGNREGVHMALLAGLPMHNTTAIHPSEWWRSSKNLDEEQVLNVLDYGCGLGKFARTLAKQCGGAGVTCRVRCVNIAEEQVRVAREIPPIGTVEFSAYDGHTLPYENATFHAVFFQESFSFHTPNQCRIAQEFHRVLVPGGRLVGLDWMSAPGLTEEEYEFWIHPINLAWEASTGTTEGVARCLRAAGFTSVELIDTAHMEGIVPASRPCRQFMADDPELKETMRQKYGSLAVQLDPKSFEERWRHVFALEAMSLAVENLMYWEGFVLATKPMQPG